MDAKTTTGATGIVPRPTQALARRTAALIRRGLRDLSSDSNWRVEKFISGRHLLAAVAPSGHVSVLFSEDASGSGTVAVYRLDSHQPPSILPSHPLRTVNGEGPNAALRWSPAGKVLLALRASEFQLFDASTGAHLGSCELPEATNASFSWSDDGQLFVAAVRAKPAMRVWRTRRDEPMLSEDPLASLDAVNLFPADGADEDPDSESQFAGFGPMAFSHDLQHLAVALKYSGEWADDSLLVTASPSLERETLVPVTGGVTDVSWTPDNETLLYCAGGQAFALQMDFQEPVLLPFTAELCRCHPSRPLAACYSSWLKNSSKGRLFIVDLKDGRVVDECPAEGVLDLCWSADAERVYAVTRSGLAYMFEGSLR